MAELDYDIAKIFEDMELDLIRRMKRSLQSHKNQELKEGFDWEMWQAAKLRELKAYRKRNAVIIGKYTSTLSKDIEEILKQQYYEGADKTDAEVRAAVENGYITKSSPDFGKINDKKLNSLIDAVNNDFSEVKKAIFRKSIDEYRKTIFTAEMNLAAGAKTLNQAIDMATKFFLERGINCITYKDGRKVNIAAYAQMALRTAHRRAFLTGEGERRKEWGECLVMTSQYMLCSETCLPWQGRVYVDDVYSGAGKEQIDRYTAKGYKRLSVAIENGLFHPNCKHTLSTWFEGISTMPVPHDESEVRQKREQVLKEQHCKQQFKKYKRLKAGSCDEENIKKYDKKVKQWQSKLKEVKNNSIANNADNGIIKLTDAEQRAINRYISSDAYKINDKLRNSKKLSNDDKDFIRNLDSALDKLPSYNGNLVRAVDIRDEKQSQIFTDSFVIGRKRLFEEYISTSVDLGYNPDANIQIYIQNATKGKNISKYNSSEQEVLYMRNSVFNVINEVKVDNKVYILLEEVNDE